MVTFRTVFVVGLLLIVHNRALSLDFTAHQRVQDDLVLWDPCVNVAINYFPKPCLQIAKWWMTIRTECAHRLPLPQAFFIVWAFRYLLTHCARSQHFCGSRSVEIMHSLCWLAFFCVERKPSTIWTSFESCLCCSFACWVRVVSCWVRVVSQNEHSTDKFWAHQWDRYGWKVPSSSNTWRWETQILRCPTSRCSFPVSANAPYNNGDLLPL